MASDPRADPSHAAVGGGSIPPSYDPPDYSSAPAGPIDFSSPSPVSITDPLPLPSALLPSQPSATHLMPSPIATPMPMPLPAVGEGSGMDISRRRSVAETDVGDRTSYHAPSRMSYQSEYDLDGVAGGASSQSLGPWDSASQRSVAPSAYTHDPYHDPYSNPYPMPAPSSAPRSAGPPRHLANKPSKAFSSAGLSYIDEEGAYYNSPATRPASMLLPNEEVEMRGLVPHAAGMGGDGMDGQEGYRGKFNEYDESPYPYPHLEGSGKPASPGKLYDWLLFPTGLDRLLGMFGVKGAKAPLEQAIERKRRGLGGQRWPVAAWTMAIAMTGVMAYELVANNTYTGKPIATSPSFNYMIGPTSEVLIRIGARFPPCMKYVEELPPTFALACLNDTSSTPTTSCSIEEICGHGGFPSGTPDQSWRFVLPIFLHVGIVHLLLNMVAQITAGAQVEREMGTVPFLIVYMAGGIYGFVLGGNFGRVGIPSVGASGALFATNACVLVDLLLHWKYEERPKLKAFLLAIEFLLGIAIGYIPNAVDGLAHLGGFAAGLLLGSILYPAIHETRRHRLITWGCRIVAIPLIVLAFVLTIKNFYTADPNAACEWCRYLSCFPLSSNNYCKGTGITVTNTSTTSTRRSWDLL